MNEAETALIALMEYVIIVCVLIKELQYEKSFKMPAVFAGSKYGKHFPSLTIQST